ncbi:MAG: TetR family transcriptional regulator [Actinobacteria bacterium]|nr:TetR family transcriptional regulator [Actinomycetota bacterium]
MPASDIHLLMDMIIDKIPGPDVDVGGSLQMLVTTLDWSDYVGRIAIGRVQSGTLRKGQNVALMQTGDRITPAKAVSVFVKEGTADANLSKIADLCGFGRTTIYKYFKNKDEIFLYALEEIFIRVETGTRELIRSKDLHAADRLIGLLEVLVRASVEDRERMTLVMDLILARKFEGLEHQTRARTMALRQAFEHVLEEGMASGELKPVKSGPMAYALFSLVEAYVIQSSIFSTFSYEDTMEATRVLIQGLKAQP